VTADEHRFSNKIYTLIIENFTEKLFEQFFGEQEILLQLDKIMGDISMALQNLKNGQKL
jgi:hypothetical protein